MAKAKQDNEYDERRETLVMERKTTWPPGTALSEAEKERLAEILHSKPREAKRLGYILTPSGLIRHITVTPDDLARLGVRV